MEETIGFSQLLNLFMDGIVQYAVYFTIAMVFLLAFKWLYNLITPNNDWELIRQQKNVAASIALAGAALGYSIAIASAAVNTINIIDFAMWGGVAIIAQLMGFYIVRLLLLPKVDARIEEGDVAAAIILGAMAVSTGLLNAACMTF
jgi:putative membrane protein